MWNWKYLRFSKNTDHPFPQIDIIGAMVIVWRVRGKIIRSVLCNIVHSAMRTHVNGPNSSLDWVMRLTFSSISSSISYLPEYWTHSVSRQEVVGGDQTWV